MAFTKGQATSGGSRNHPATVIEEGSEAIVNNVPVTLFEGQELPEGVKAEVIERESSIDRLLEENVTKSQHGFPGTKGTGV